MDRYEATIRNLEAAEAETAAVTLQRSRDRRLLRRLDALLARVENDCSHRPKAPAAPHLLRTLAPFAEREGLQTPNDEKLSNAQLVEAIFAVQDVILERQRHLYEALTGTVIRDTELGDDPSWVA